MAKAKKQGDEIEETVKNTGPKAKDDRLRISLRIKDKAAEAYLRQMGQVHRAMFIELAIIQYIEEGNDRAHHWLTANIRNNGHRCSAEPQAIAAKQADTVSLQASAPTGDEKPEPIAYKETTGDVTSNNYSNMGIEVD